MTAPIDSQVLRAAQHTLPYHRWEHVLKKQQGW
jgi:hypothetical protein